MTDSDTLQLHALPHDHSLTLFMHVFVPHTPGGAAVEPNIRNCLALPGPCNVMDLRSDVNVCIYLRAAKETSKFYLLNRIHNRQGFT